MKNGMKTTTATITYVFEEDEVASCEGTNYVLAVDAKTKTTVYLALRDSIYCKPGFVIRCMDTEIWDGKTLPNFTGRVIERQFVPVSTKVRSLYRFNLLLHNLFSKNKSVLAEVVEMVEGNNSHLFEDRCSRLGLWVKVRFADGSVMPIEVSNYEFSKIFLGSYLFVEKTENKENYTCLL